MKLTVKLLNGSNLQVEVPDETTTIKDLKQLLADKVGWPPDQQKLIFRGRVLGDELSCNEANLEDETALHLVRKASPDDLPPSSSTSREPQQNYSQNSDIHGVRVETASGIAGVAGRGNSQDGPMMAGRRRLHLLNSLVNQIRTTIEPFGRAVEAPYLFRPLESDPVAWLRSSVVSGNMSGSSEAQVEADAYLGQYRIVLMQIMEIAQRITPWADIVSQAASSPRDFTHEAARVYQCAFDTIDMMIHELAHLFHSLSDFSIDFSKPAGERTLRVQPRSTTEHRAVLSTAITLPVTALAAPNLGRAIAQELSRSQGVQTIGGPYGVGIGIQTSNTLGLDRNSNPNSNNNNEAAAIASQIASLLQQIDANGAFRGTEAHTGIITTMEPSEDYEEADRIARCTSHLMHAQRPDLPVDMHIEFGNVEAQYGSPFSFASDILYLSSMPTIKTLLEYIRGMEDDNSVQQNEIFSFFATVADELITSKDGVPLFEDFEFLSNQQNIPLQGVLGEVFYNKFIKYIQDVRTAISTNHDGTRFGLVELMRGLISIFAEDIRAIFLVLDRQNRARWYFEQVADKLIPFVSEGSRRVVVDEIRKCYNYSDGTTSDLYLKIKFSEEASRRQ